MDVKDRVRALRDALGLTQEKVAELSRELLRTEVVKIEKGQNQATSHRIREALSRAFGVRLDDMSAYLDARIDLDELLRRRERPQASALDLDALPPNLRSLVEKSAPGTYADAEILQAAMFRDLKGADLTEEEWHKYIMWLRAAADRVDGEAKMRAAGFEVAPALRVVTDDDIETEKAQRAAARSKKKR
jgi:transcriptional regulator with XRE-family HTH domain